MAEAPGYTATEAMRGDVSQESPIGDELAGLHAGIDRLEHQIGRLRGKLQPVLRTIPETADESPLKEVPTGSAFNEALRQARVRVNAAADLVIRTLDQLDV